MMRNRPKGANFCGLPALLLLLILFGIYNINFRLVRIDDSVPARLLPFSLLINHSIYLDHWVEPYLASARGPLRVYFVVKSHGRWVSSYPLITPLIVTPLYIPAAVWLTYLPPPLRVNPAIRVSVIDLMEKISASFLAVLSALVLYLAVRRVAPLQTSLIVTLAYGVASPTWVISSQALWKHGVGELSFAFLLYALVRDSASHTYPVWVGAALAVAAANTPPEGIMILPFLVYFGRRSITSLLRFLTPLVAVGIPVVLYNWYFLGNPLMTYPAYASAPDHAATFFVRTSFADAFAGLLVSPGRGLFIYVPWTVFAIWGAVRIWRSRNYAWGRYLIVGIVLVFLGYAKFSGWWAGWCFGPRYLTNLMPFLAFFLVPVWPRIEKQSVLKAAFVLAFLAAVWIEVVGAFCYPSGHWDSVPVSVDRAPGRLWDWRDNPISRNWHAGAAPPLLYDDLKLLSQVPALERQLRQVQRPSAAKRRN
ncbi:MAG: hypothetical protein ACRD2G_05385 [Terriglobia bacterium]